MPPLEQLLDRLQTRVIAHRHDRSLDAADAETFELLDLTLLAFADGEGPAALAAAEVLPLLRRLDLEQHPWAEALTRSIRDHLAEQGTPDERPIAHRLEVGRRMLATHFFMEGKSPSLAEFGLVGVEEDGNIKLGLGLQTRDGSLQRFLVQFAKRTGFNAPRLALRPFFDIEADALAEALEAGTAEVDSFLRAQFVFKYDPALRRVVAQLPDLWVTRFERLAASLPARRLQLELSAGARLVSARDLAQTFEIQSLRGLALAFDLQPMLQRVPPDHLGASSEQDRLGSLAERVLIRVHGSAFQHWSQRIQALVEGQGRVSDRHYLESELLGPDALHQPWRFSYDQPLFDTDSSEASSVPIPGRDYIVQADDRLSHIARNAYFGQADYRYLLEHNPQLRSPSVTAGLRIHIPQWPTYRTAIPLDLVRERVMPYADGEYVNLSERSLGPFPDPDEQARIESVLSQLQTLFVSDLPGATADELPDGWAVLVKGQPVISLQDADLAVAREHFPEEKRPLEAWARHLAAELRGDIVLDTHHHLSCGLRPMEPNRRRWLRASLRRAILENTLDDITLKAHDGGLSYEIIDSSGCALIHFTEEDYHAIRLRPGRRLTDLELPDVTFRRQASLLWLSDLRHDGAELMVPPVEHFHQYNGSANHIPVPVGTSVYGLAPGTVAQCRSEGSSHAVLIDHGQGLFCRFRHLGTLSVRLGQRVQTNTLIGRSGLNSDTRQPGLSIELERRSAELSSSAWTDPGAESLDVTANLGQLTHELHCRVRETEA